MRLAAFQAAQIITGTSGRHYSLVEGASRHHPNVWVARKLHDDGQVIFKHPIRSDPADQAKAQRQLDTEISLLTGSLKGLKGIRQLIDTVSLENGKTCGGIFEHASVDLHDFHITLKRRMSVSQLKEFARQLLTALSQLHSRNYVHTDIKPENVVFSDPGSGSISEDEVKLIDFGVVSLSEDDRERTITNTWWRSPESWLGMRWGPAADVWSFGAIIGTLLMEPGTGLFQPPSGFSSMSIDEKECAWLSGLTTMVPFPKAFIDRAAEVERNFLASLSPRLMPDGQPMTLALVGQYFHAPKDGWAFVTDILKADPNDRPTTNDLLQHPWLKEMPWSTFLSRLVKAYR